MAYLICPSHFHHSPCRRGISLALSAVEVASCCERFLETSSKYCQSEVKDLWPWYWYWIHYYPTKNTNHLMENKMGVAEMVIYELNLLDLWKQWHMRGSAWSLSCPCSPYLDWCSWNSWWKTDLQTQNAYPISFLSNRVASNASSSSLGLDWWLPMQYGPTPCFPWMDTELYSGAAGSPEMGNDWHFKARCCQGMGRGARYPPWVELEAEYWNSK